MEEERRKENDVGLTHRGLVGSQKELGGQKEVRKSATGVRSCGIHELSQNVTSL